MKRPNIIRNLNKTLFIAIALLWIGLVGSTNAFAQDDQQNYRQYKGEVVDSDTNKPLVFATIGLDGTNISTVTNTEGQFLLKVPEKTEGDKVVVSFLGYKSKIVPLLQLNRERNRIPLEISVTELPEVNISVPKDAAALVRETMKRKGDNYFKDPTQMTAFYRETIKKRKKNVSLSEAVVNIYKTPYTSGRKDAIQLYKARKSTDYSKLDTLALKLQGGPYNTIFVDIMKYPQYIFASESFSDYVFTFARSTTINNKLIYVIDFKQRPEIARPLYQGQLYIDADNKILTSAIFSLNITNRELASRLFVRRKPANANVWPTDVAYRVDYREKNGRWYYGYSNVQMEFKVNWKKRLFNSRYSMTCEMAVTDWAKNIDGNHPKFKNQLKSSVIMSDEAVGFADPDFWGEYNIIEPEKSIESAIKKIQRHLKRS
ncbi:carboxypeptidase-like regulatory domain-containing protein [Flavobacteriaceae bacterium F89]|uniref:Carboxypeptidase-like regulatory domain-containing protein n=1 Tax=Cerina litoralis TaxID=2874477 RepID=A0AAE3EY04_9FLAO|nr:carboxypeptidase-like regulatory domain-containing protein [Cerina litoralis]MCG2462439.1 carboxypeptidase-like regulatory domain-containing protein [Cerina litoralis]